MGYQDAALIGTVKAQAVCLSRLRCKHSHLCYNPVGPDKPLEVSVCFTVYRQHFCIQRYRYLSFLRVGRKYLVEQGFLLVLGRVRPVLLQTGT